MVVINHYMVSVQLWPDLFMAGPRRPGRSLPLDSQRPARPGTGRLVVGGGDLVEVAASAGLEAVVDRPEHLRGRLSRGRIAHEFVGQVRIEEGEAAVEMDQLGSDEESLFVLELGGAAAPVGLVAIGEFA